MENTLQHRRPEPRKLPYQLLKRITDGFSDDQKLGNGAFGSVYKGVHENGEAIAVKVLRNVIEFDHKQFRNEFENLALLDHQNVVRLVGYCNETEETLMEYEGKQVIAHEIRLALCMEYVDNGSLSKHISDEHHQELNWHICYKIIKGICEGLNYLRYGLANPIWHLDLKPDNILLDKNMVPKIADFGLSRLFGEETTFITASYVGTRGYLPPEYIQRQIISKEFDIYSLGVIITKIMVGSKGYNSIDDMTDEKFAEHVHNNWKGRLVEILSPSSVEGLCQQVKTCIEIALKCLNPQRRERPSIQEIISELKKTETMIGDLAVQPKQFPDEEPILAGQSDISERHSPGHQNLEHRPGSLAKNVLPENKLKEFTQDNDEKKWRETICRNINIFTQDEIQKITKNYTRLIGEGGFGQVYQGALDDGTLVVVKKYIHHFKERSAEELIVHSQINHKNIVRLLGYCAEENALMMVTEFMSNGNLSSLLHGSDNPIGFGTRLRIAIECAEALSYMHSSMYKPVIHGGINPANILLDDKLSAKLSDFGISRILSMDITEYTINVTGSRVYMDPELLKGCIDPKNDVYSFGVVLIELLTRKKSLEHMESANLIEKFMQSIQKGKTAREMFDAEITNVDVKILVKIGKLAVDCISRDFKERPEMQHVVQRLRMFTNEYHQQGQEKTGQWSLWGTRKINRGSTMYSIVNSKLGSLDIFNRSARRSSIRKRFPITITIYTKEELKPVLKRTNLIGKGRFREFYKGYLADNGLVVVKKLINVGSEAKDQSANEILVQSQVIHKNILKLIGFCLEVDVPILVYEFASRGSLEDILHGSNNIPLNLDLRLQIATQSARGIAYMHSETTTQIRHGDIKPANILFTDDFVVKISDFGISRMIDNDKEYTDFVIGDINYLDPVYMQTGLLTIKSDVYSFGVVLLELITRKKATYKNSLVKKFHESYIDGMGMRVVELVDPEIAAIENIELLDGLARLIKQCLDPDVDRRPEMTNVEEYLLILTKTHHQGMQKIDQWSQRNTRGGTNSSRAHNTLRNISNAARKSFIGKGGPILERCNNITIYTKEELEPFLESRNLIGKGGFCEVYKYLDADNHLVAVKKPIIVGSEEKDRSENEILVQSQVAHKNILKLIGCCLEVDVPILVYEFASRGSLEDILHSSNNMPLNLDLRLQIATQSARGIAYMHSETTAQILHGDIKPANILLTDDFVVKISGFRLSRLIDNDQKYVDQVIGDLNYMDPVYLRTGLITDKTDVYSFGVVLLELITRKKAAYHNKLKVHFLESFREGVRVAELVDPEIAAIENSEVLDDLGRMIRQCLNLDVDERPAMTYVAERLSEMLKRSRTD